MDLNAFIAMTYLLSKGKTIKSCQSSPHWVRIIAKFPIVLPGPYEQVCWDKKR